VDDLAQQGRIIGRVHEELKRHVIAAQEPTSMKCDCHPNKEIKRARSDVTERAKEVSQNRVILYMIKYIQLTLKLSSSLCVKMYS